jgi:hypothetical protein
LYIKYRSNPIPSKCRRGRKQRDDISGQVVYEFDLTVNDDGQHVDARNRRTLDDRPDLDGEGLSPTR